MPVLHLHRRFLTILERARVHVDDGRVVYDTASEDGTSVRSWNIPTLNATAVILGQGSSITQAAARRLAEDDVMFAFVGSGGTPLLMASQDYRPGDRLQRWIAKWPDEAWRLAASKEIQKARCEAITRCWGQYRKEGTFKGDPLEVVDEFASKYRRAASVDQLMGYEGALVKGLCREAARATKVKWTDRKQGQAADRPNRLLDHGSHLAYGIASAVLWAYGIPGSLPVTHGASRSGGLVLDIADAIKDAVILPTAFQCSAKPDAHDQDFRDLVVDRLHGAAVGPNGCLGYLFDLVDRLVALEARA